MSSCKLDSTQNRSFASKKRKQLKLNKLKCEFEKKSSFLVHFSKLKLSFSIKKMAISTSKRAQTILIGFKRRCCLLRCDFYCYCLHFFTHTFSAKIIIWTKTKITSNGIAYRRCDTQSYVIQSIAVNFNLIPLSLLFLWFNLIGYCVCMWCSRCFICSFIPLFIEKQQQWKPNPTFFVVSAIFNSIFWYNFLNRKQ